MDWDTLAGVLVLASVAFEDNQQDRKKLDNFEDKMKVLKLDNLMFQVNMLAEELVEELLPFAWVAVVLGEYKGKDMELGIEMDTVADPLKDPNFELTCYK